MIHFHIVTLFPESIDAYFKASIIKRAVEGKMIKIDFYNPRDFTAEKDARVDRRPYGGGPGMVLEAESVLLAVTKAIGKNKAEVLFFATDGELFDENMARELAHEPRLTRMGKTSRQTRSKNIVMICGHYEGIDERVVEILKAKKVSMGNYVLTGGELPAAIIVDAVSRFVPGVLGNSNSLENLRITKHKKEAESMATSAKVYTRPEILVWKRKKYPVPPVLLSGNHAEIEKWKKQKDT
ncbi:MAG: trmD [Candidatus Kaiserbacteria bacterium]|nr:trmD [Candidatus Kaiserbacteria bacterium]